ncbi:MAG: hypothetical protein ACM3XZ_05450 [Betaproteobacteria bacterium]
MRSLRLGLVMTLLLGLLTVVSLPTLAAFELMGGQATLIVDKGRTVKGDLYAAAQTIIVDGTVTGDLVAAGQTVVVNGRVDGSVLAAGSQVTLNGPIGENVRVAGATVTITNKVGRNASLAGSDLILTSSSELGGGLLAGASRLELRGRVADDVLAGAETLLLGGKVGGGVRADVGRLDVSPEAEVTGKVFYRSRQEAQVPGSAQVKGGVQFEPRPAPTVNVNWRRVGQVINAGWFLGLLLLSVVLWLLYPERLAELTIPAKRTWSRGFLFGLLGLILGPVAIGLAFASFIGIPIALVLLGLYLGGLIFSLPLAASLAARQVLATYYPDLTPHPALVAALGMAGLFLLGLVPFVGPLVRFLAIILGLGLLVTGLQPAQS